MSIKEIRPEEINQAFIDEKLEEIKAAAGSGMALSALSGGVDSSVVTVLAHQALGDRLKAVFVESGLMRQLEGSDIVDTFFHLGVPVTVISAENLFLKALKDVTDPEKKREAVTQTFYKKIFAELSKDRKVKCLLQGTILTDVEETAAGIKRQHNVFSQIGIDPEKEFGYRIVEPLIRLRKDGVRALAKMLRLPEFIYNRMPFPGPGLAARIIGEVNREELKIIRKATEIVEDTLSGIAAFQYLAILHKDRVTGMRSGERVYGRQIEVRCWDSVDARTATPTPLDDLLKQIMVGRITTKIPQVVSVTFNETPKPPSTIEAV